MANAMYQQGSPYLLSQADKLSLRYTTLQNLGQKFTLG